MSKDNPYQGYHAQLLEKLERLERENAELNHALNVAQIELRLNGCSAAADEVAKLHDSARKEAQP